MKCGCRYGTHSERGCRREAYGVYRRRRSFLFWSWWALVVVCDLCTFTGDEYVCEVAK